MMGDDTTIRVKRETWRSLHERKDPGQTMDEVLWELIEEDQADVAQAARER